MAEDVDSGLFREIEEELRQDKVADAWKAYGNYFIGAIVALVIGVASYQGWRTYDLNARTADGEQFASAVELSGTEPEGAIKAFQEMSETAGSGYAVLARFQSAGLKAQAGDFSGAAADYLALSEDTGMKASYQDLAIILGTLQELNFDTSGSGAFAKKLGALMTADNPWRFSARELSGFIAYQNGKKEEARGLYEVNAKDDAAPSGIRNRANEMLAIIGK